MARFRLGWVPVGLSLAAVGGGQERGGLRVPVRDPDQVREVTREVLSRPEFRAPERSSMERVIDWVLEVIGRLLAALGGSGAG
ncbi:MAG: hypothetical protein ACRDLC_11500, partial [Actinomycetota bacterium]